MVAALVSAGRTVATAESLTGGLVCAALTSVPGSSAVVRGAVVSYATDTKRDVLGVDAELLRQQGAVAAQTAEQMARGVRRLMGADWGVATTGVAGPDPSEGKPVGTVFVAVSGPGSREEQAGVTALHLSGSRWQIREQTVRAALTALAAALTEGAPRSGDEQCRPGGVRLEDDDP